jgi:hypothetical protein
MHKKLSTDISRPYLPIKTRLSGLMSQSLARSQLKQPSILSSQIYSFQKNPAMVLAFTQEALSPEDPEQQRNDEGNKHAGR